MCRFQAKTEDSSKMDINVVLQADVEKVRFAVNIEIQVNIQVRRLRHNYKADKIVKIIQKVKENILDEDIVKVGQTVKGLF